MTRLLRAALLLVIVAGSSACALSRSHPRIADLTSYPGRYQDRTVNIEGVVTSSWGIPFMPFGAYKVDDGTGEVTVLSQGRRTPARGAHVRVKGRVDEVAVLGGRPIGLHLTEERLSVSRSGRLFRP